MRKSFSLSTAFAVAFAVVAPAVSLFSPVSAAAVTVAVSSPANAEFPASTATDVTFGYNASATQFAAANTVIVTITPAVAAAVTDCTVATVDADGDATPDGAFGGFSTTGATYTFTAATTNAVAGGVDFCLRFPATTAQGSYSISLTDTNDNDFGAALVYVGDDNDVTVTAIVGPTLSFNIRNLADTADTNICYMGAVDTTSQPNGDGTVNAGEGECGYSLAIATNAALGFTATIREQGNFTNGTHNMADQADNTPFAAGTEGYGLDFVAPGAGLTLVSEAGTFATDSSPLPGTSTNFLTSTGATTYVAGTDATDVTAVVHGLSVSTSTPTGVYTHVVTYYVAAAF